MRRTNIYLEPAQTEKLDRLAAEEGVSRAEIIRRLLDRALAGEEDARARDFAVLDLSFGALADVEMVEREPGDREEHLTRVWQSSG